MNHISVLQKELLEYVDPRPNQNFIDATIGDGGDALAILAETQPQGKLLGIDLDKKALGDLRADIESKQIKNRIILVCDSFANIGKIVKKNNFGPVHGIIADLGVSSMELEERRKGFSFLRDEPLDMRFGDGDLTAGKIVNDFKKEELERILKEFGEEKFSRQIVKEILAERKLRPIGTTFQLIKIIRKATPPWYHRKRIHPATRTFQALRIAVNDELNNLNKFLPQALDILIRGGRLAIISFHSLEDRIVKNFFRQKNRENFIRILTKKPIGPGCQEKGENPRSRSAKLRAAVKL